MTTRSGYVVSPYIYLYGRELALFRYFHEQRKVPLPDDALSIAFDAKRQDLFDYFLEQGADVNGVDAIGNSILHTFVYDEQWPMAKTLLQRGLDLNLTNRDGVTAFLHILSINRLSTAQKLLEYTDTNILPPGQTNLMEAALWTQMFYYGGEDAGLSPEVIQFITDLSNGK